MINEINKKINRKLGKLIRISLWKLCFTSLENLFKKIKKNIFIYKELIEKAIILILIIVFAFILGLSLGISQKQLNRAIFTSPEGFDIELNENFFIQMDELFKLKGNYKDTPKVRNN